MGLGLQDVESDTEGEDEEEDRNDEPERSSRGIGLCARRAHHSRPSISADGADARRADMPQTAAANGTGESSWMSIAPESIAGQPL